MLDGLQVQLRPVGALELSLVERIAVSLWRQRRLVNAETAAIAISMSPATIAKWVGRGLDIGEYGNNAIKPKDLEPPDQEQLEWCKAVIAECEGDLKLNQLQKKAPRVFEQLTEDAVGEGSLAEYLEDVGGLTDYLYEMADWCRKELEKAKQFEQIAKLTGTVM